MEENKMVWGKQNKKMNEEKVEAPLPPLVTTPTRSESKVEYKRFEMTPFYEEKGMIIQNKETGEQYDSIAMLEYLANRIDEIYDILKG
jgi:hypothetical protein